MRFPLRDAQLVMMSPLDALRKTPRRFSFGAAVRLLWLPAGARDPGEAIRFAASSSLAQPEAEIEAARPERPAKLVTGMIGLTGRKPADEAMFVAAMIEAATQRRHHQA